MKKTITEREVEALARDGSLTVTRDMLLTPGAREYASAKGIRLTYETKITQAAPPTQGDELARIIEAVVAEEMSKRAPPPPSAPPPSDVVPLPIEIKESAAVDPAFSRSAWDSECRERILNASMPHEVAGSRAIVTVLGMNRPGIVARIASVVADCGGDLADVSQVILDRYFSLIFIVNLAGIEQHAANFRLFKERLTDEATRIGQIEIVVMHEDIFQAMHKV